MLKENQKVVLEKDKGGRLLSVKQKVRWEEIFILAVCLGPPAHPSANFIMTSFSHGVEDTKCKCIETMRAVWGCWDVRTHRTPLVLGSQFPGQGEHSD